MYKVKLMVTHESRTGTGALIEAVDHIAEFPLKANSGEIGGMSKFIEDVLKSTVSTFNNPKTIKIEKIRDKFEKEDDGNE